MHSTLNRRRTVISGIRFLICGWPRDSHYTLTLGAEGSSAACAWQLAELEKECAAGDTTDLPSLLDYCQTTATSWNTADIRVDTPRSKLPAIVQQLAEQKHTSWGHAGNGIIYIPSPQLDQALVEFAAHYSPANRDRTRATLASSLKETFDPSRVLTQNTEKK